MKKSVISIALIMLLLFVGCGRTEQTEETSSALPVAENTTISESTTISDKETSESETTVKQNSNSETTTKPAEQKSAGQTTTKKVTTTQKQTTTKTQTTTRKQTTTQKVTTTQKQTTTKRVTTTAKPTTQSKKLTKSDIDWVQSQAHSYIKSKGMSVNSNVGSFSYRTSSSNYTDRNTLLSKIKETIDFEYNECINSGWKKVDMYVSVSSDSNGDYWLVVMYG